MLTAYKTSVEAPDLSMDVQHTEALLKAGALQRAIFNSANFSSIATDARGVIQIFNVGAERMLGYTAVEVMNKITPADISDPMEVIARAKALSAELSTPITPGFEALVFKASRGIEDIYELTYIRKDRSRFPAVVSVTALRDAQDAIIGYLLIGIDNTARKQAEAALVKAGALQSAIFNSANFSSIATDAKGVIQIFNVGAERMLGYTAAEVMNKITPADISDPQELIARAEALSAELGTPITPGFEALVFKASRGIEDIYELTYIRKDGSRFPAVVSVTALRDDHDAVIGYLLIGTDNTARKHIEANRNELDRRLRDQQFYTRSLIESSIDALMTTDPSGIITDVNKQMEALTSCTRDELIGAPFKSYFTDPEKAEAGIKRVLSEKKITNYELTARARDGKETVVSYNATTFYDRDRKLQGVFAAARDITEGRLTEKRLNDQRLELKRSNEALEVFASVASHDLQEPLRKILAFGELLDRTAGPTLAGEGRQHLDRMLNAATRMRTLINDLLSYSQVTARSKPFVRTELARIAREVIADLETAIADAGGVVEVGELPVIEADPIQMRQLLQNLLGNALKFRREGEPLIVQLASSSVGGRHCVLTVTDNGIGFSEEYSEKVFKMFERLHGRLEYEGSGIGLAICRKIVERHGGTITATSTRRSGRDLHGHPAFHTDPIGTRLMIDDKHKIPITILVCDDDEDDRMLTKQALEQAHVSNSIRFVEDGEQLLDYLYQRGAYAGESGKAPRPGLILLDLNMPKMGGREALRVIKGDETLRDIPVVVLSTSRLDEDVIRSYQLGVNSFISKPVTFSGLVEAMNVLGRYWLEIVELPPAVS